MKTSISIHNIKLSAKIPGKSLENIQKSFTNIKKTYNNFIVVQPDQSDVIFCFFKYPTTGKIKKYRENHVNITNVKSFHGIKDAISILSINLSIPIKSIKFKIDCITATSTIVNRKLDIEKFLINNRDLKTQFNQEKFPGLFVYVEKCTLILFNSGKIVIIGVKSFQDLQNTCNWIKNRLATSTIIQSIKNYSYRS